MRKISLSLVCVASIAILCYSCKETNKTGALIPADAGVVIHVNATSLNSKLSWDEIRQTNWFKEMHTDSDDSLAQKLMEDPQNSGIDTKSDLIFFTKNEGNAGYMAFEGYIKDVAAFEAFNKKVSKGAEVSKGGDLNSIRLGGESVVTWNKDRFAYVVYAPFMKTAAFSLNEGQEQTSAISADSLFLISKGLFSLKSDNSLGKNEKFSDMLKEGGDIHFWMNSEHLYNGVGAGMLSMMKINALIQGNVSANTVTFDEGKITLKSKTYYNKEIANLLDKYEPRDVSADVINRIPSQNVVAAFVFNYPPEGLKDFLKVIGVDGMVNGFLGKANYSIDEFIKANKGDVVIAVTDLTMKSQQMTIPNPDGEPFTYNRSQPDFKVLFATSVRDRAAFDKLIGTVKSQMGDFTKELPEVTYTLQNDWFAAGNSGEQVTKFLAGGNNKLAFTDKISGHPFGGYVDIQAIMKATGTNLNDTASRTAFEASMKMWQDIVMTGGEYKNGALTGEVVVNLVDKSTNSLKQLNKYFDQLATTYKNQRKQYEYKMPEIDTLTVPVPEN